MLRSHRWLVAPALAALAAWLPLTAACGIDDAGAFFEDASAPPAFSSTPPPDAGDAPPGRSAREGDLYEGGSPVEAHVGGDGGVASRLYFAVVGDTRPAAKDDVAGYPSAVISMIYGRIAALEPRPAFVVSTGDYQFASTSGDAAFEEVALYAKARALFAGPLFPAMGNHECTGATASNCGAGNRDGVTDPLRAFEQQLLAPIGKTLPYYEVDFAASRPAATATATATRSWTAKLVVVAANAWNAEQDTWLEAALARPTTYTFVVRHEPASATTAPGVTPSEAILARHPYTLAICGHKHAYEHPRKREIVVGNGGAPLTGDSHYGFAVIDQQADGTLVVDMVDSATGRVDPTFHFAAEP